MSEGQDDVELTTHWRPPKGRPRVPQSREATSNKWPKTERIDTSRQPNGIQTTLGISHHRVDKPLRVSLISEPHVPECPPKGKRQIIASSVGCLGCAVELPAVAFCFWGRQGCQSDLVGNVPDRSAWREDLWKFSVGTRRKKGSGLLRHLSCSGWPRWFNLLFLSRFIKYRKGLHPDQSRDQLENLHFPCASGRTFNIWINCPLPDSLGQPAPCHIHVLLCLSLPRLLRHSY